MANQPKFLACIAINFRVLLLLAILYEWQSDSNSGASDSSIYVLFRTPHHYMIQEIIIPSVP